MKSLYAFGLTSVVLVASTSTTMASADTKKVMRSDHVSVTQGIAQYDINLFIDIRRVTRNDHVSTLSNERVTLSKRVSAS